MADLKLLSSGFFYPQNRESWLLWSICTSYHTTRHHIL